MTETRTTCCYCGVGCGIVVGADGGVRGDRAHPANHGKLCSKGAALGQTLDDRGRLLHPTIDGAAASWDAALDLVADTFRGTIAAHGPDSVAFYVSGQCLTEDYYVANKLMKGFIGSANIDSNSRLCMASSVAGHIRAFGEDIVPGIYEDFDEADLVLLVGSNTAWCHPVLHQRLLATRAARGTKIVVIDPRRTATADAADLHLPLAGDTDVALFAGLLAYLHASGAVDRAWTARHTDGLEPALAAAQPFADPDDVASECGIDPEAVETLFEWFAGTERVMTVYSQGVNQSASGTDKVSAILNCHLATGRIGRAGMGPFSLTGQPNAMGGREVGGLANQLAAHMRFDDAADRAALRKTWGSTTLPERPGLKAVELFDALADRRVKAVWIVATNPAATLPRAGRVRAALAACPFVVASDCWPTDTTALARVVLPAAGWGEKDGTVTNSERRISRQRRFRAAPGEARPDWWMFAQVARRMGWDGQFAWDSPAAVFREHAALSGIRAGRGKLFDIARLAALDDANYDSLSPVAWPLPAEGAAEGGRLFAQGGFPTPDGRAQIVPVAWEAAASPSPGGRGSSVPPLPPGEGRGEGASVRLNTGRVRDQWHTMTRTGRVASLMAHTPEPLLAIHPADAARAGIVHGQLARIATAHGSVTLRADLRHAQRRGEVFAPMHWTDDFVSAGPVGRVVDATVDPVSGQPALKSSRAVLTPVAEVFAGLLLREQGGPLPRRNLHWTRLPIARGQQYRLAGLADMPQGAALSAFAADLVGAPDDAEWLEVSDPRRRTLRLAALLDGRLIGCLFLAPHAAALPRPEPLAAMVGTVPSDAMRAVLLAGRLPGGVVAEEGPRVCACFGVGRAAIRHAVATHRLRSAAEIGAHLQAGTNCGSCIPELEEILRDVRAPAA